MANIDIAWHETFPKIQNGVKMIFDENAMQAFAEMVL